MIIIRANYVRIGPDEFIDCRLLSYTVDRSFLTTDELTQHTEPQRLTRIRFITKEGIKYDYEPNPTEQYDFKIEIADPT